MSCLVLCWCCARAARAQRRLAEVVLVFAAGLCADVSSSRAAQPARRRRPEEVCERGGGGGAFVALAGQLMLEDGPWMRCVVRGARQPSMRRQAARAPLQEAPWEPAAASALQCNPAGKASSSRRRWSSLAVVGVWWDCGRLAQPSAALFASLPLWQK